MDGNYLKGKSMALQFVEWQPTNNKEREALRKFPFWVVSGHSSPLRQTSIFIVPIELGILNHENARWILSEQVIRVPENCDD
jgi:hypothetical protein